MVTLTINVANENEPGAVTVSGVAQVGAVLTASLADPDGAASSAVWQWSRAGSLSGSFADISGATSATYTAVDADAGMYLRATATYTDALGAQDQTAAATTDAAVTSAPKFALDQGTEQVSTLDETSTSSTSVPTDHLAQSFATPGTVSDSFVLFGVRVALSVPAGQAAAASIWSNDASGFRELPGAVLPAGTLSATGAFDANVSTAEAFMSSSGIALAGGTKYWLVVSRTSLGGTGRMAISVVDAEEEFTDSVTGWSLGGYAFDQDNVADSIDWEGVSSPSPLKAAILTGPTRTVAENATAGDVGAAVTATDADGDTLTYSVAATTDSDATEHLTAFNEDFGLDAATGQITVRPGAVIDFETRDTYTVLYQVTDSEDASGGTESTPAIDDSLTLTVTVTNANEAGAVSISGTAQVGAVLTATLADPDGAVSSQTWQWSRSDAQSGPFTAIASADSATYTPVAADDGKYLKAAVSYADVHGAGQSAEATTAAVLAAAAVHTVPAFSAVDFPGDAAARSVAENATAGDVGAAVTATDADGDTLTYSVAATTDSDATEHLTAFNEDFGLDAATGQITVRPGAVIDFETRDTYTVLYQVTDSEDASGGTESTPAIDDSLTLTVTVTNANEAGAVSISGTAQVGAVLTATLADPDGAVSSQTWQWSRSDAQSGPFTAIASADSATYTPVAADDGKYLKAAVSYADVHGAGQSAEATTAAVLAAAAVHTVPAFSAVDFPGDAAARSVAENATAGDVGAAVTATDADGDTLTYSVAATTDSDATEHLTAFNEDFGLDAATGQITVRPGAVIDFETRDTYTVLYQVTDSEDASGGTESTPAIDDSLTLTVTVTNANEAGAVSISGTAQVGAVLTATLADPDGAVSSQTWQWSRSDAQSGPFTAIASADSATYTPVAADDGKYLKAAVSYADVHGAGQSAEATTAAVLAAAAVHTVPAFSAVDFPGDAAARSVAENATAGDVGAAVTATDADGDTLTYSVAATTDSDATEHLTAFNEDFGLDAATGQITVRPGAVIDFETRDTYTVLYQVTDSEDASGGTESTPAIDDSLTLTVTVTNANEAGAVSISGTAQVGAVLTATLADPDGAVSSQTWQWSRSDAQSGPFTAIASADSATYTPVAADDGKYLKAAVSYADVHGAGQSAEATTAAVLAAAAVHTVPAFSAVDFPGDAAARSVAENATAGDVGAAVTATDADGDTLTYSVAATTDSDATEHLTAFNEDFGLDAATGQITVRPGAVIDFETRDTYTVLYQVTDSEDASGGTESTPAIDDSLTLTVTVTNANEAGAVSISGTAQVGAVLTATLADPDGAVSSQTWQWSRSDAQSGPFTAIASADSATYTPVAADDGKYLKAAVSYADVHGAGQSAEATTAAVLAAAAVHTVPAFSAVDFPGDAAARSVAENATAGDVGAAVTATDADGDTLTYSVAATTDSDATEHLTAFNEDFGLDAATGQITVRPGAVIDFETRDTYTVLYQVTDSEDASGGTESTPAIDDSLTLTVTVTNANEAGAVSISGTAQVGAVLTATLADPDGAVSSQTWQWSRSDAQSGPFTAIASADSATYTPVAADDGKYLKAAVSYADVHGAGQSAEATTAAVLAAAAVHTVPAFSAVDFPGDAAARSVAENATAGDVGAAVTATDADGDTLTYSVAATTDSDATEHLTAFNEDFGLDAATGQITVRPGAVIDFETRDTYTVLYQVTDSEDASGGTESTPAIDDSLTLTVTVTNANEAGAVSISGTAQVGAVLTATLADPDGAVSSQTWQWSRSDAQSGPFTAIASADSATYTPVAADDGKYLKAAVSYADVHGAGQSAEATTAAVLAVNEVSRNSIVVTIEQVPDGSTFVEGTWAPYRLVFTKFGGGLTSRDDVEVEVSFAWENESPIVGTNGQASRAEFSLPFVDVWDTAVKILDNDVGNPDGTLTIRITGCEIAGTGQCVIGTPSEIEVTITDDDGGPAAAPPGPPDMPRLVCASSGGDYDPTGIAVSWKAPEFVGGAPVQSYELRYRLTPQFVNGSLVLPEWEYWPQRVVAPSAALSTILTGLTTGVSYTVQVRAHNANGPGLWSESNYFRVGYSDEVCDIIDQYTPQLN